MRNRTRAFRLAAAAALGLSLAQLWARLKAALTGPAEPAPRREGAAPGAAGAVFAPAPAPAKTVSRKKDCVLFITCNGLYD